MTLDVISRKLITDIFLLLILGLPRALVGQAFCLLSFLMVRKVAISGTAFSAEGQIAGQKEMMATLTPDMFPAEWKQEYARKNPDPSGFPNLLAKVKQSAKEQ